MFATPLHHHKKNRQVLIIATVTGSYDALVDEKSGFPLLKIFNEVDEVFAYLNDVLNNANHPDQLPSFILIDSRTIENESVRILSKLKAITRLEKIPRIVMVDQRHQNLADQYYSAGASSCLPIPGDPQKLNDLLVLTSDYWLNIVTLP